MTIEDRQRVATWAVKTLREAVLPPLGSGGYRALTDLLRLIGQTKAPPKPARGPRCGRRTLYSKSWLTTRVRPPLHAPPLP